MTPTPVGPYRPARGPHIPWRNWAVGMRVVVRRKLDQGGYGDALGYITKLTEEGLEIETCRGPVWIDADTIYLGKPVPPPPKKRPRRAQPEQR